MLFFNIVSLYFNTLFSRYINLTIDGTIYPSQHFSIWPGFCYDTPETFGPYYVHFTFHVYKILHFKSIFDHFVPTLSYYPELALTITCWLPKCKLDILPIRTNVKTHKITTSLMDQLYTTNNEFYNICKHFMHKFIYIY